MLELHEINKCSKINTFLGNVLDVAWSHDGSILAYTKKNSKKICTASIGLQIYENNTTLLEV